MQDALLIYYCLAGMRSAGCFLIAASMLRCLQATAMLVRSTIVGESSNAGAMQRRFLRAALPLRRFFAPARSLSAPAILATQRRRAQAFPHPENSVASVR